MTRFRTLAAVAIVAAIALPGGAARAAYPAASEDYFDSRAQVFVTPVPGCASTAVLLDVVVEGPTLVRRSDPVVLPGGFPHIETELVSMTLTSIGGPPLTIRQDPDRQSFGGVTAQDPGTDFPADSFFDVFVEVELDLLPGITFENIAPVHMTSVIHSLPPHAFPYLPPPSTCIPLKVEGGPDVPVLWLIHAEHLPETHRECFLVNAIALIHPQPPNVPLFFSAQGEGQFVRGDLPPGGDTIDIELVALELHGIMQDPFRGPVPGRGSEPPRIGSPGGVIGIPSGDNWQLDSFFDIVYTIEWADLTQTYRARMEGTYGPQGGNLHQVGAAPSTDGETLMEQLSLNFDKIDACIEPYPRS